MVYHKRTSHLSLIGETTICATKAGPGIWKQKQTLFKAVDLDFSRMHTQTVSKDTKEVQAFVYEQTQHGSYLEIFESFNESLNLIKFETHEQIKFFCKNSPELLKLEGFTNFLFKDLDNDFWVASVSFYGSDLKIYVDSLSGSLQESTKIGFYFVVLANP